MMRLAAEEMSIEGAGVGVGTDVGVGVGFGVGKGVGLGNSVEITVGSGAVSFTTMVVVSLCEASMKALVLVMEVVTFPPVVVTVTVCWSVRSEYPASVIFLFCMYRMITIYAWLFSAVRNFLLSSGCSVDDTFAPKETVPNGVS